MTREEQIREAAKKTTGLFSYRNGYSTAEDAFVAGAQWADANQPNPWISVEDQLPEVNQQVYAAIPNLCGTEYATLEYLGDNRWRQDTTEYTYEFSEGVTYWMPIPELPKEERK